MTWAEARGLIAATAALIVLAVSITIAGLQAQSGGASGETSHALPTPIPSGRGGFGDADDFVHPGVLVSRAQLDFVKAKIEAGAEPWLSDYRDMRDHRYAQLTWEPSPRPTVECGLFQRPNSGCTEESDDALAAYTHALIWYLTGDRKHAEKSIQILDAWSAVFRQHINGNAPLQAGWSGSAFVRAAELIKHTYPDWPEASIQRTAQMFRQSFLPLLLAGTDHHRAGNWELIMLDAATGMAVFLDDRKTFNTAINKWRARLPAYVYLAKDGPAPKGPPGRKLTKQELLAFWGDQSVYVDGLSQETCRDFLHTGWGLTAAAHVAETARIQGMDLYGEARERLTKALELHAGYEEGEPVPKWLCGGKVELGFGPVPDVAYNHYANRLGLELPETKQLVQRERQQPPGFFYPWERLTHANNPN
jgi:hypothetical protein